MIGMMHRVCCHYPRLWKFKTIMTAQFTAEEIIEITGGRLAQGMMPDGTGAICTDTRQITDGQWYLAFSGERFDGHDFLGDAIAAGAIGCIVAERPNYPIGNPNYPLIAVEDTLRAYQMLATSWRKRVNPKVIGITGSSGKTTTKEMCAAVVSTARRTHKSQANENNEFGVPKTILAMPADTQVLILEMAMRGLGQIAELAITALPDVGIIVNAGVAHLGPLASVNNIIRAKCELFEYLDPLKGIAIVGQPTTALMTRVWQVFPGTVEAFQPDLVQEISVTPEVTIFSVDGFITQFEIRAHGQSHLQDAWCAILAGRYVGLDDATIAKGIKSYEPVGGRGNRLSAVSGALVIDESYNANPDSVKSSVSTFADSRVFPQGKKYVVLGDLAELGDDTASLHEQLGAWIKSQKLTRLITVGSLARHIAAGAQGAAFEVLACQNQDEAEDILRPLLTPDAAVLVKGSHSANLDKLVKRLLSLSAVV